MIRYSIEPGNTWKDKDFCHSGEIYLTYSGKKLLETATKVGLDALKTVSKMVVHKLTEATGEFIGKKLLMKLQDQNLCLIRIREILKKQLFHQKKEKKY